MCTQVNKYNNMYLTSVKTENLSSNFVFKSFERNQRFTTLRHVIPD